MKKLFGQDPRNNEYARNDDPAHVLLKVITLARIYNTHTYAVYHAARYIQGRAKEIDEALNKSDPDIVDIIANVTLDHSEKHAWSFASKYCSWHKPASYPMWDSRVCVYLSCLNKYLRSVKETPFASPYNWTKYREFKKLIEAFRDRYKLGSFSFKEIDMFLWKYGEKQKD